MYSSVWLKDDLVSARVPSHFKRSLTHQPMPVAARSKALVCGHSLPGVVGSNPSGGMDVCLVCVIRQTPLLRADPSSREILLSMACRCVCVCVCMCDQV